MHPARWQGILPLQVTVSKSFKMNDWKKNAYNSVPQFLRKVRPSYAVLLQRRNLWSAMNDSLTNANPSFDERSDKRWSWDLSSVHLLEERDLHSPIHCKDLEATWWREWDAVQVATEAERFITRLDWSKQTQSLLTPSWEQGGRIPFWEILPGARAVRKSNSSSLNIQTSRKDVVLAWWRHLGTLLIAEDRKLGGWFQYYCRFNSKSCRS